MSDEKTKAGKALLTNAYDLNSPQSHLEYYRQVAKAYDADFGGGMGYHSPTALAALFHRHRGEAGQRVLDVGCGTGLVAEAFKLPAQEIDGVDISPEMLAVAKAKGLYANLFEVDLTADISAICNGYGSVVSAGTFTHGHLGPGVLEQLVQAGTIGAQFLIGVNCHHYEEMGFRATVDAMVRAGKIELIDQPAIQMYQNATHEHADAQALVLIFKRLT